MFKINSFKVQDTLYNLFTNDAELLELMNNPADDEERNNRFRRENADISEIDSENFPFMTITLFDTITTFNYLRSIGLLEIDIYSANRYDTSLIYERMNKLIHSNYPDMHIIAEGQVATGIRGLYCYRVRYNPLINA